MNWKLLAPLLKLPGVHGIANRYAINSYCNSTPSRPRPYTLWSEADKPAAEDEQGPVSDYTSWPSLTDRKYSGRHLPPADPGYTKSLPPDVPYNATTQATGAVTGLFTRPDRKMVEDRSSLLFMFFAQWFTDSILRVHPVDRRLNTSNHDIDLCQIYGLERATTDLLRSKKDGRLRSQLIDGHEFLDHLCEADGAGGWKVREQYSSLPYATLLDAVIPPKQFPLERRQSLYATGLERGNSSVGYVALNTLFMREHNRLCGELKKRNPSWLDERLFQTARMINIVILLKLVVEDYINHILGFDFFRLDTSFAERQRWYRPNWIALEFDLLYRWHGLAPDSITIGGTRLSNTDFRNNNALLEKTGLGAVIDAASRQPAGRIGLGNTPDYLWEAEYRAIRMSRDFRLQPYNAYRERFGLARLRSFAELTQDGALQQKLEELYGDINDLEFLVGLFAEQASPGSLFGELLTRMVAYDAFSQIFTNPLLAREVYNEKTFTAYGLEVIEQTTSIEALVKRNVSDPAVRASLGVLRDA